MKKSKFLKSSKSLLSRSFNPSKCKTSLKLAVSRLRLLRNKKEAQVKQTRREISALLESGQDQTARIRVEHVIREEKMMAAFDLIEIYCELIVARLPIIETQKICPVDLKEAIASVIYASPRCGDVPELVEVKKQFTEKYGKDFVAAAIELRPECGVSRMLVDKLSTLAPEGEAKTKILSAIAREHNVEWVAKSFEESSEPASDLLSGPTTFAKEPSLHDPTPREKARFYRGDGDEAVAPGRRRWNMDFKDATSAAEAAAESAELASIAARAAAELSSRGRVTRQGSSESPRGGNWASEQFSQPSRVQNEHIDRGNFTNIGGRFEPRASTDDGSMDRVAYRGERRPSFKARAEKGQDFEDDDVVSRASTDDGSMERVGERRNPMNEAYRGERRPSFKARVEKGQDFEDDDVVSRASTDDGSMERVGERRNPMNEAFRGERRPSFKARVEKGQDFEDDDVVSRASTDDGSMERVGERRNSMNEAYGGERRPSFKARVEKGQDFEDDDVVSRASTDDGSMERVGDRRNSMNEAFRGERRPSFKARVEKGQDFEDEDVVSRASTDDGSMERVGDRRNPMNEAYRGERRPSFKSRAGKGQDFEDNEGKHEEASRGSSVVPRASTNDGSMERVAYRGETRPSFKSRPEKGQDFGDEEGIYDEATHGPGVVFDKSDSDHESHDGLDRSPASYDEPKQSPSTTEKAFAPVFAPTTSPPSIRGSRMLHESSPEREEGLNFSRLTGGLRQKGHNYPSFGKNNQHETSLEPKPVARTSRLHSGISRRTRAAPSNHEHEEAQQPSRGNAYNSRRSLHRHSSEKAEAGATERSKLPRTKTEPIDVMNTNSPNRASHVHPKLPDYDNLVQFFQKNRA